MFRKKIFSYLSILLILPAPIFALSYTESSNGLETPAMEGGRTEFEMGDVNADGHADLVSIGDHGSPYINTDEHGIMVWFGDGAGNWSVVQTGNFGYGGIALGDVNNDGFMDAAYGMHHNYSGVDLGDQILEVALGDGSGSNWTAYDDGLATNGESWGMFCTDLADIDNDGDLDLVSNSFGASAGVHVYLNNGNGTWTQSFGFLGGNSTMDVTFGDVNNDGAADFAAAQQNGTVYLNNGFGNFTLADGNLPPAGSMGRLGPDLGDVDNDGDQDLAFCNSSGGVEVWLWAGNSIWLSASTGLPSSGSYESTQLYDLDNDEFMDLAGFSDGQVTVWKGDGGNSWTLDTSFAIGTPGYFVAFRTGTDADHNGYPDFVLVEDEGSWPNDQNHPKFFKEASLPTDLGIKLKYPRGSEKFVTNTVIFIDWCSSVPVFAPFSTVKLELSTTGVSGPWTLIAENLPNNGRYQWIIPDVDPSNNCYIKATVKSGTNEAQNLNIRPFIISNFVPVEVFEFSISSIKQ